MQNQSLQSPLLWASTEVPVKTRTALVLQNYCLPCLKCPCSMTCSMQIKFRIIGLDFYALTLMTRLLNLFKTSDTEQMLTKYICGLWPFHALSLFFFFKSTSQTHQIKKILFKGIYLQIKITLSRQIHAQL